jgi:hypothetical protein
MRRVEPSEVDWATPPLLDPANVGKYVWYVWNGNRSNMSPEPIAKIGRTNVHVGRHRPVSMRVEPGGEWASGSLNDFTVSCMTEKFRLEEDERVLLADRIRRVLWRYVPIEVIREIDRMVKEYQ